MCTHCFIEDQNAIFKPFYEAKETFGTLKRRTSILNETLEASEYLMMLLSTVVVLLPDEVTYFGRSSPHWSIHDL